MKATKKQIEEVTAEANVQNKDVNECLNYLNFCSASMYKVMGAKGVVNSVNYKRVCNSVFSASTENYRNGVSGKSSL